MKKLLLLLILAISLQSYASGQSTNLRNKLNVPTTSDTFILINGDTIPIEQYRQAEIALNSKGAFVNLEFCRKDLQTDQAKDDIIFVQNKAIEEYMEQSAKKDTVISDQSKTISDLQGRYLATSDMLVMSEKGLRKERKARKFFQYCFYGMLGVAFYLGVK